MFPSVFASSRYLAVIQVHEMSSSSTTLGGDCRRAKLLYDRLGFTTYWDAWDSVFASDWNCMNFIDKLLS